MGVQTEFLEMLDERGKHKEPAKPNDTMRVGLAIEICEKIVRKANRFDALVSLPPIEWDIENDLPMLTDDAFYGMILFSEMFDGVRMFPYMTKNDTKYYIGAT